MPSPPQDVSLEQISGVDEIIQVSWELPRDTGMGDDSFALLRLELLITGDLASDNLALNVSQYTLVTTFRNLRLGAKLSAKIRAVNTAGASTWSPFTSPAVTILRLPSAPLNLTTTPSQPLSLQNLDSSRSTADGEHGLELSSAHTDGIDLVDTGGIWVNISWLAPLTTGLHDVSWHLDLYEIEQASVETNGITQTSISRNCSAYDKLYHIRGQNAKPMEVMVHVQKGCFTTWRVWGRNGRGWGNWSVSVSHTKGYASAVRNLSLVIASVLPYTWSGTRQRTLARPSSWIMSYFSSI